jgi:hypothetical protein
MYILIDEQVDQCERAKEHYMSQVLLRAGIQLGFNQCLFFGLH